MGRPTNEKYNRIRTETTCDLGSGCICTVMANLPLQAHMVLLHPLQGLAGSAKGPGLSPLNLLKTMKCVPNE